MQKHGIIKGDKLRISDTPQPGYKPIHFAEIPDFDQLTQAVFQTLGIDRGEYIEAGVEVKEVEQEKGEYFFWH